MFRVLFLMIALLAGLIAGPYLSGQQGYVRVETANTVYEMSLTTLVILFVVTLAVIYSLEWLVTRFFRLSSNTYNWFSRRKRVKAQRQTLEGLMKMNEGDYAKAEKLIGKNAKHSAEPVLNLIKAAEAAQQRGDEFSANRYLIEATELAGSDNLVVEIARTRILLQQNKLPAARSSVDSLLEMSVAEDKQPNKSHYLAFEPSVGADLSALWQADAESSGNGKGGGRGWGALSSLGWWDYCPAGLDD